MLLWCGGVDRQILVTPAEVFRYSNLGLLILAVAALGATSFTIFAAVVIGHFSVTLIPFALGWGMLIFFIDRAIVTEPFYHERQARDALEHAGDSMAAAAPRAVAPPNGAGASEPSGPPDADEAARPTVSVTAMALPAPWKGSLIRGAVYLARVVITVCIAFLVAETIVLLIFNPEVESQLSVLHASEFKQAVTAFANTQQSLLREYETNLKNFAQAQHKEFKQVNTDRVRLADEGQGTSGPGLTGKTGFGPQYQHDAAALRHDTRVLNGLDTTLSKDTKLVTSQKLFIAGLYAQNARILAEQRAGPLAAQKKQIYANGGFAEREKAFNNFLKQNNGDVVATVGVWALRFLLISFDLLPLGAKLLNPYTIYGRRMSERALAIRYHDLIQQQALLGDLNQQARLRGLWSQHNYQLERRQAAWRTSWRMNHMSDPD